MKFTSFFQGKKSSNEQLPEVEISGPKKALGRLEENAPSTNIVERREQILINAANVTRTESTNHLIMNNGPSLNNPPITGPSILEEQPDYRKEGLTEDEAILKPSYDEKVTHITPVNNKTEVLGVEPSPIEVAMNPPIHEHIEAVEEPEDYQEQDYDPFDESYSETGFTELEVTFINGKQFSYLFNIGKSKFEQQWFDEIYSVGVFTAKDIYGNLITLSPKGKDHETVVFKIKEGILPK